MDSVNKTLYIPLYGKAYVSRRGLFLADKKAEEIWAREGFALRGKARSKWLAFYMGIRSAVFDDWLRCQLAQDREAAVLHIGCGMDSRVLRVAAPDRRWYDVDFPEVIRERQRYYTAGGSYRMVGADVRDPRWLAEIEGSSAIVVMEGVSMYLTTAQLQALTAALCRRFDRLTLLTDCYTELAARLSRRRNPVREVGVEQVYGLDEPRQIEGGGLTFTAELPMTPREKIDALQGAEKAVFQTLYAGKMSQKLYRLYEFRKG